MKQHEKYQLIWLLNQELLRSSRPDTKTDDSIIKYVTEHGQWNKM